jgi:predicted glutamine amidotransferase
MLVSHGSNVDVKKLLEDIIIIAKGNNEINEKNKKKGMFKHEEGWGMAYLKNSKWHLYKSRNAVFDDPQVKELKKLKCRAAVIHVRRRTMGKRSLQNIQPLKFSNNEGEFIFAHNGTIFDDLKEYHKYIQGDSDSVKMFNNIIYAYKHKTSSFTIKEYTSVNFFLVTENKIEVVQKYKTNPKYSTMKMLNHKGTITVSSEVLPSFKHKKWEKLENNTILEFELDKH